MGDRSLPLYEEKLPVCFFLARFHFSVSVTIALVGSSTFGNSLL